MSRLTQSALPTHSRLSVYVDDPILATVAQSPFEARRAQALLLLRWAALKFPLSLEKAKRGTTLTWTSAQFSLLAVPEWGVRVRVKPELVEDARLMGTATLASNVVPRKDLESLVGKLTHIASIIATLRPFLTDLYAALHCFAPPNAPSNCIWRRQIFPAMSWVRVFLSEVVGPLQRDYWLSAYSTAAGAIEFVLDASPWGLGGYLVVQGIVTSWFACGLSDAELSALSIERGSCRSQQAVEALAALVALRCWASIWQSRRCLLRLRSDSISALILVLKPVSYTHLTLPTKRIV